MKFEQAQDQIMQFIAQYNQNMSFEVHEEDRSEKASQIFSEFNKE